MRAGNQSAGVTEEAKVWLLGVPLSTLDQQQLLAYLRERIAHGRPCMVLSGNIYSFNLAYEQAWLRDLFRRASVVRLDGEGVRWGARLLALETPPRMTWADFAWPLAAEGAANGWTFYLLGGREGVAERAQAKLQVRHPALRVVGARHGYFDKTSGSAENEAVIERINACAPDLLIVGFGMPLQERWLAENRSRIRATVVMTGGAVFDYVSGESTRAPQWMTDHGLEWLGRLVREPRRLWKRYLIGNPVFFWRILRQRLRRLPME